MKKLLTIVLAAAMILQTSAVAFAAEKVNTAITVSNETITRDVQTVDITASADMKDVKTSFDKQKSAWLTRAEAVLGESAEAEVNKVPVTGSFTFNLYYPNTSDFVMDKSVINGSGMSGFDENAKALFTEKSRTVGTSGGYSVLKIELEVKNDITVGTLSSLLKEMTFKAEGAKATKAGSYRVMGDITGKVTAKTSYMGTAFSQDMEFAADKVSAGITVINPTLTFKFTVKGLTGDKTVSIKIGDKTFTLDTTTAEGDKIFSAEVTEGKYNLEIKIGDTTITKVVDVNDTNKTGEYEVPADESSVINTTVKNEGSSASGSSSTEGVVVDTDSAAEDLSKNDDVKEALEDENTTVSFEVEIKDTDSDKQNKAETEIDNDSTMDVETDDVKHITIKTVLEKIVGEAKEAINNVTEKVKVHIPYTKLKDTKLKIWSVGDDGTVTEVADTEYTVDEDDGYIELSVPVNEETSYAVIPYSDPVEPTVTKHTVTFDPNNNTSSWIVDVEDGKTVTEPSSNPKKSGYVFNGWYVGSTSGSLYNFSTPVTDDITLVAGYRKSSSQYGSSAGSSYIPIILNSEDTQTWKNPFLDVAEGDWFYDVVKTAHRYELMNGVEANYFDPDADVTRGMFVTVLYRMAGSPITGVLDFVDVPSYEYYASAIAWAHTNGIVKGISDTEFAPEDKITREQMAAILYRYMNANNLDTSVGSNTNVLSYSDSSDMSDYAVEAIQWAVGSGVMNGNGDGTFAPANNATRAETAAVFVRTLKLIEEMAK